MEPITYYCLSFLPSKSSTPVPFYRCFPPSLCPPPPNHFIILPLTSHCTQQGPELILLSFHKTLLQRDSPISFSVLLKRLYHKAFSNNPNPKQPIPSSLNYTLKHLLPLTLIVVSLSCPINFSVKVKSSYLVCPQ